MKPSQTQKSEAELMDEIIRREGVGSPKLRQFGRDHGGEGRGDGPNGERNQGQHQPGGGQGENADKPAEGSATDPDAPDGAKSGPP